MKSKKYLLQHEGSKRMLNIKKGDGGGGGRGQGGVGIKDAPVFLSSLELKDKELHALFSEVGSSISKKLEEQIDDRTKNIEANVTIISADLEILQKNLTELTTRIEELEKKIP